jgi:uncharacterized membrane protein
MSTKTILIIFGVILLAVILASSSGVTTVVESWHAHGLFYIRSYNGHVYEASACNPEMIIQGTAIEFRAMGVDLALGKWRLISPIIFSCKVIMQPMPELPLPP